MITFSISARRKKEDMPIMDYLAKYFKDILLTQIKYIFGFTEFCEIYGGRPYYWRELSDTDVDSLYSKNIGIRLPLTNHFVTYDEYKKCEPLLKKYHKTGNSVVVVVDNLAKWIKNDYPKYSVEASAIKNISSIDQIINTNKVYDGITLPMRFSRNIDFLKSIQNKEKITLFGNGSCGTFCSNNICYEAISEGMKKGGIGFKCSIPTIAKMSVGILNFDIKSLSDLGFSRFKILNYKNLVIM
jgi:hypothetical protein